jgi:hypothetical protein
METKRHEKRQAKAVKRWPPEPKATGSNPVSRASVTARKQAGTTASSAARKATSEKAARSGPVLLKDQPLRAIRAEFRALWRKYLQAADPEDIRMLKDELARVWVSESSVVVARKRGDREVRS